MHMSWLRKIAILTVVPCLLHTGIAVADNPHKGPSAVIDFEDLSTGFVPCPIPGPPGSPCDPTSDMAGVGTTYSSQGYTFFYAPAPGEPFPTAFHVVGPFWPFNDGTNALNPNSDNAAVTLQRDDGRPFALAAMDLAELNGARGDLDAVVVFRGVTTSGELVSHEIKLDNRDGFQRVHFPGKFKDLLYVQWQQGDNVTNNPHMFDNVVVFTTEFQPREP